MITRRSFLAGACATALTASCSRPTPSSPAPASVPVPVPAVAASERIALGFIGLGEHGVGVNLKNFLTQPDAQVAAFCDVDAERLDGAAKMTGIAGIYTTGDWREIVARDDLDAVVISTPDHWHVPISMAAIKAGKDVFCEKPLSLTIEQGRVVSDAAARYGCVFQLGTPNRSRRHYLRACELVRNGRAGKLHTIRMHIYRGHSDSEQNRFAAGTPEPIPRGFDYDMWLGPAPEAPYCKARCHFNYRYVRDYSGGNITDLGAHILDVAQWGNNTEHTGPVSVEGHGVFPDCGIYTVATDWHVTFQFANGVALVLDSGGFGVRFEGTDGWVETGAEGLTASSPALLAERIGPEEIHLRTCPEGEQRDFLNCVRNRAEAYAPAEIEHRSITLGHLANIAMLAGGKLRWDPEQEVFPDNAAANRMLQRAMRSPWSL